MHPSLPTVLPGGVKLLEVGECPDCTWQCVTAQRPVHKTRPTRTRETAVPTVTTLHPRTVTHSEWVCAAITRSPLRFSALASRTSTGTFFSCSSSVTWGGSIAVCVYSLPLHLTFLFFFSSFFGCSLEPSSGVHKESTDLSSNSASSCVVLVCGSFGTLPVAAGHCP